jgi:hypothetical protein
MLMQKQYSKAAETLEPSLQHARNVGRHWEAGVCMLLMGSQVDLAATGCEFDTPTLQKWLDQGLDAMAADPPPAGAHCALAAGILVSQHSHCALCAARARKLSLPRHLARVT